MEVGAALGCLAASGGCPPAKEIIEALKDGANATDVKPPKALPEEPFAITMSEAVIGSALIWVRERFVGFVYLLKFLLSPLLAVMVGVIFEGQLAKSLLYFFVGSISIDTEDLVIIPFCWHIYKTLSSLEAV